jgi:Xaa-Pro aminopeptidase
MKDDLNRLMAERNLDGFLVMGNGHGWVMRYLTGGAYMEGAVLMQRADGPLTLIHGAMERDTAAATGLATICRDDRFDRYELMKKHNGNQLEANADFIAQALEAVGLRGRIGLYGMDEIGAALALVRRVSELVEDIELVGEYGETLFNTARETKDNAELEELKRAGVLTCKVMGEVQAFIQGHGVRNEIVMRKDGNPLTIGDVKTFIRERLFVYEMDQDHGNIFAQGRDAGVPHNHGELSMPLQLGKSIVFDFYPTVPSGYYHDITRTWSLGYATDEVQQTWDTVKTAFDNIMADFKVGRATRDFQVMTCDLFESKGHKTMRSHPGTQEGYVHSLGHGIGLEIHESPNMSHLESNKAVLKPGYVITVEPGLYYPERGYGVRIEDSVAFTETGELIYLTDYPYDLVIPMTKSA